MFRSACVLLLLLPSLAYAQEGRVSGLVADSSGPVAYVSVAVGGSSLTTSTDAAGRFALTDVPAGSQLLVISAIGYMRLERRFEMHPSVPGEFWAESCLSPRPMNWMKWW